MSCTIELKEISIEKKFIMPTDGIQTFGHKTFGHKTFGHKTFGHKVAGTTFGHSIKSSL